MEGQILTLELIAASIRFETAAVAHQKHSCWLQKRPAGPLDQISAQIRGGEQTRMVGCALKHVELGEAVALLGAPKVKCLIHLR